MSRTTLVSAIFGVLALPCVAGVGVSPPANARLPLEASLRDLYGTSQTLGAALDRPALLLFADYACKNSCETMLARAAHAFSASGLRAGIDARIFVIDLDPAGDAAHASSMRWRAFAQESSAATVARYFTSVEVHALARALGYRYTYDADAQTYVYPEVAFVIGDDGRLLHVIAAKRLSADVVRAAFPVATDAVGEQAPATVARRLAPPAALILLAGLVLLLRGGGAWKRALPMHLLRLRLRRA